TVKNGSDVTVSNYLGKVHFTSTDGLAGLPADYTFTATNRGVYNFTKLSLSSVGSQKITATDSFRATKNRTKSAIGVNKANTTITEGTSNTTSSFGQSINIFATVNIFAPGAGIADGTVTFSEANTTLGTATLSSGKATLTLNTLSVGNHSVKAIYNGNA